MNRIYSATALSKTNVPVPILQSGRPAGSLYNPQKEAVQFVQQASCADMFLVLGVGAGYHITQLAQKFPNAKILAADYSEEDITFLQKTMPEISLIEKKQNITLFPQKKLEHILLQQYLPAIFPVFSVLELRSWCNEIPEETESILQRIRTVLDIISADFATQSHFGKIWQHNILKNLSFVRKSREIIIPTEKTAVIVAAGPSLDRTCGYITKNRSTVYVIATDTAYKSLRHRKIFCNAVISIDGQAVSKNHFSGKNDPETLMIFDIAANCSTVRKAEENGNTVLFSTTNHPLALFAENINEAQTFLKLDAGNGTVTSAAIDFAAQAGFRDIIVLGADFGYINGKSYTSGTYFDDIFSEEQNRLRTLEKLYDELLFRSPLKKITPEKATTQLLDSYRRSFEQWIERAHFSVSYKDEIYVLQRNAYETEQNAAKLFQRAIDLRRFKQTAVQKAAELREDNWYDRTSILQTALLPFIAYARKSKDLKNCPYKQLLNLALDDFVMYTELL